MKAPLLKRLPREFLAEKGKYLVIFLFLTATIGFVSGFLVADGSMIAAYEESFEKYQIEDGNFEIEEKADELLLQKLEKEGVKIYPNFYLEKETDSDGDGRRDSTIRIFVKRTEGNLECLMEGKFPRKSNEIAVDRMYAENNGIEVGEQITVQKKPVTVSGLVALSDYSALFSDNGDMMFDSVKFGVGIMTEEGFASLEGSQPHYSYSWKYDEQPEGEKEEKEYSDKFLKALGQSAVIIHYIPQYENQAIQFTGDDMGGDRVMMLWLLYILIAIMAFVFAVTTNHTIVREAAVIGTLRASGYTRRELLMHYITNPLFVTFMAAIAGNVLGYTVFKNLAAGMYYGSYSLPTYETRWNSEAFALTTVIPFLIMLVINVCLIWRKLLLSPLCFLRRDLSRTGSKRAVRLPASSFFTRFRLRIILQNLSSYVTLFVGILFANILLLFGMMMSPLLEHFQDKTIEGMLSEYQYILKEPAETQNALAERCCIASMDTTETDLKQEAVTIYGVGEDSRYIDITFSEDEVYISDGYAQKYQITSGDEITLRESYGGAKHRFTVKGIYDYPAALAVFMPQKVFWQCFDLEEGYFNAYLSDERLTDLPEKLVAATVTREDLTKVSRQLDVSMGKMFYLVNLFALAIFALLIYLLTKLIIERNAASISMVKILGYRNGEIGRLYLLATTWVVVFSILFSLFAATAVIRLLFRAILSGYTGWLPFYVEPVIYLKMFGTGVVLYILVALLQLGRIKKIPMDEALKNAE